MVEYIVLGTILIVVWAAVIAAFFATFLIARLIYEGDTKRFESIVIKDEDLPLYLDGKLTSKPEYDIPSSLDPEDFKSTWEKRMAAEEAERRKQNKGIQAWLRRKRP